MAGRNRLEVLERVAEETETPPQSPPKQTEPDGEWLTIALLVLQVLGKRSVAFVGHLIPIIALGSAFILWWSVRDNPSIYQLVWLGTYAAFMLAILVVRRV